MSARERSIWAVKPLPIPRKTPVGQLAGSEDGGPAQHLADDDPGRIAFRRDLDRLPDADVGDVALDDLGADDARGLGLKIEHGRDVQGRGAGARVGVAAHDPAIHGRADDGQFEIVLGLGQTGAGGLDRRALRLQARFGGGDLVTRLIHALGGDEVGRDQARWC